MRGSGLLVLEVSGFFVHLFLNKLNHQCFKRVAKTWWRWPRVEHQVQGLECQPFWPPPGQGRQLPNPLGQGRRRRQKISSHLRYL